MAHMEMPTAAAFVPYAPALRPQGWTVSASSTATGHLAGAVLGSHGSSFWQSAPLRGRIHLPQSVTVRFAKPTVVSGLTYVPHGMRGVIGSFVVALSGDGIHFGAPASTSREIATAPAPGEATERAVSRTARTSCATQPTRLRLRFAPHVP